MDKYEINSKKFLVDIFFETQNSLFYIKKI
jgi:hypothetical protein